MSSARVRAGGGVTISPRSIALMLGIAAAYVAFAELGFSMASATKQVTAVWPPTGIAVAALVLFGYRIWPGVWLGAFASNALSHEPPLTAVAIALGNTAGPMAAAYFMRHVGEFDPAIERVRDVLVLLIGTAIGMTITASNGVLNLAFAHIVPWRAFAPTWQLWWTGDAMGALLFAPVIFTWWRPMRSRFTWRAALEPFALSVALVGISSVTFLSRISAGYSVYPIIIWSALRFHQRATTLVVVATAAIAIAGTSLGLGPFVTGSLDVRLSALVVFLAMFAVTGLVLGAIMSERRQALAQLRDAEHRLRVLAEQVPQMVWMADASGSVEWVNRRWVDYTGQTTAETLGWGWQKALHPVDHQRTMLDWPRSIETGETFSVESRIRKRDGEYRWFLMRAEPMRDAAGTVIRWHGTNTDIDDKSRELLQTTRISETLQAALLPSRLPERDDYRFDALYLTAEQAALVGGDWYDAFELADGRIVVSIGDVVGHGVAAAITAARIRQSIVATAHECDDPATILSRVNRLMLVQNDGIATAFVGIIGDDLTALTYASAGHPTPIVAAPTIRAHQLPLGGPPLGVEDELSLASQVSALADRAVVIFYTDGVTEFRRDLAAAESALLAAANDLVRRADASRPSLAVKQAVIGSANPADDAVILVLQISPSVALPKPGQPELRKRWTFHSSDAYFANAGRHEVTNFLSGLGVFGDDLARSELIVGELLANTVKHAPGIVELHVDFEGPRPIFTVTDAGPGLRASATRLPIDALDDYGRGLFLVKTLAEQFMVSATPGGGTTITVALPVTTRGPC